MEAQDHVNASVSDDDPEIGFAKLEGEFFLYFMRKYSIILGRNTESSQVDLDLSIFGGRVMRVSRRHARIFYDFEHRHFALEVLGRHGCTIQGITYPPGSDPVKLNSQDLIEIAGIQIYFLLPKYSIFATAAQRTAALQSGLGMRGKLKKRKSSGGGESSISNSYGINADSIGTPGEHAS